jgi:transcriptional regulator with XRE-family HTH domain
MPEDWWDYVSRIAGRDAIQKDISERTGIEQSTLSRWKLRKNPPNADAVVQFARSYGQSPVAALIAARYLDLADVDGAIEIVDTATSDLSTAELVKRIHELLDELERRRHEAETPD